MNFFRWLGKERALRAANRLARKGDTQGALDRLRAELALSPENLELRIQEAWALADLKRYDEALAAVRAGLALSPDDATLLMIQGEIFYATGGYEDARRTLHRALEKSGENLRVEYALGLAYVALGDMDRAARYFESSVRYDKSLIQSRMLAMSERYLFEHRLKS